MLLECKHFHFGRNEFSGSVPPKMLHENMTLIHLLLDNNKFEGSIPSTLGLVTPMEVLRLDGNSFTGSISSNISNLTNLTEMDMSNNSFDPSDASSWFTELPALTTLVMEGTKLEGEVPESLFSLPQSETVILKRNNFGGTFDLGFGQSKKLRLVDMQNNNISAFTQRSHHDDLQLMTAISTLGFMLSNQTIKPPSKFGPFYFTTAEPYTTFADITVDEPKKSFSMTAIIGIAAGGCVLVILVCVGAIICVRKKRNSKTVEPAKSFSFASGTS